MERGSRASGRRAPAPPGPPPTPEALREAALAHLARFAATEAGLRRVLERRVLRWARAAEGAGLPDPEAAARARALVPGVVAALARARAVDDAAFAESRARTLGRAGRSRRAIVAHLAAKGVSSELAAAAPADDPEQELDAALLRLRRRRLGPFAPAADAPEADLPRTLGALARAGFTQDVAERACRMQPGEAEARILRRRREG